jgi:hypothetical protein
MKKILITSIILATLANFGCSDFLDEVPYSKFDKSEAYKSSTLVYINTVASIYSAMGIQGCSYSDYAYLSEFTSDLSMIPGRQGDWVDGGNHQNAFFHTWTPSFATFKTTWNDIYKIVGLCNSAIEDLQEMIDNGGESFLADYIYEIRACRAYMYYHALNLFGRVPIVTSSELGVGDVVQPTRSKVYEFVRDELAEIIPYLPEGPSSDDGSEYYGRMTKAVGYMMMAKLAINAPVFASDTWNDGRFTGGISSVESYITNSGKNIQITLDGQTRNVWETVVYCQEQLAAEGYELESDIKSNFLIDNEGSSENIFVSPNDATTYKLWQNLSWYSLNYEHAAAMGMYGANGPCATLKTCYLFGGTYDEATKTEDFSNADPRWDKFFYWGDVYVDGVRVTSAVAPDYNSYATYLAFEARPDYSVADYSNAEGLYIVKWGGARVKKVEVDLTATFAAYTNADFVVYRYSDALLLAAEAKYRLGQTADALTLLNEVRNRVGATEKTSVDLQAILDERALELVWEPTRREDLIRFGLYTEATIDKYAGVKHANVAGDWVYDATGYTTVFPISPDVLNLNANLTQNPGY